MNYNQFEPAFWAENTQDVLDDSKGAVGLVSFSEIGAPSVDIPLNTLVSDAVPIETGGRAFSHTALHRDAIYGISQSNKKYVLRDVTTRESFDFFTGRPHQVLHGQSIIKSETFPPSPNPDISSLNIRIYGFREWIGQHAFLLREDKTSLSFSFDKNGNYDCLIYEDDEIVISAKYSSIRAQRYDYDFSFTDDYFLSIVFKRHKSLDDALDVFYQMYDFITFCMGYQGNIEEVFFTLDNNPYEFEYYDQFVSGRSEDARRLARKSPLPYSRIKDQSQQLVDKWLRATAEAQKTYRMASVMLGKESTNNLELIFLTATQAFEGVSRVGENQEELNSEEFDRRFRIVLDSITDKKVREWADRKLKYANHKSAGTLANALFNKLRCFAHYVVPDKEQFLKDLRESRNAHTHVREGTNDHYLTGRPLYWLARTVQVLHYGAVMLNLGFSPEEILTIFRESGFLDSYISHAQEIYHN